MVLMKTILFAAAGSAVGVCAGPAAVCLIGFKAGGIAAGSYAAGMMTSMSVGGMTTAGGLVATLQSIGATGTLLGSPIATGAVGVVGGTIGVVTSSILALW